MANTGRHSRTTTIQSSKSSQRYYKNQRTGCIHACSTVLPIHHNFIESSQQPLLTRLSGTHVKINTSSSTSINCYCQRTSGSGPQKSKAHETSSTRSTSISRHISRRRHASTGPNGRLNTILLCSNNTSNANWPNIYRPNRTIPQTSQQGGNTIIYLVRL
jgi:hypothetical protein